MKLFRCLILSALPDVVVVAQAADQPWFTRHLTGMEVGPTGAQFGHSDANDVGYAARFDGRGIVRRCVAAHSEYLLLWVRDGGSAPVKTSGKLKGATAVNSATELKMISNKVTRRIEDIHETVSLKS